MLGQDGAGCESAEREDGGGEVCHGNLGVVLDSTMIAGL
jgi:hypothetical protein